MSAAPPVLPRGTRNGSRNPSQRPFPPVPRRRLRTATRMFASSGGSPAHLPDMTDEIPAGLPVILTQAEVAELLKIPPRTLETSRLTSAGPPFHPVGRHVRYELGEVMAWFREQDRHV